MKVRIKSKLVLLLPVLALFSLPAHASNNKVISKTMCKSINKIIDMSAMNSLNYLIGNKISRTKWNYKGEPLNYLSIKVPGSVDYSYIETVKTYGFHVIKIPLLYGTERRLTVKANKQVFAELVHCLGKRVSSTIRKYRSISADEGVRLSLTVLRSKTGNALTLKIVEPALYDKYASICTGLKTLINDLTGKRKIISSYAGKKITRPSNIGYIEKLKSFSYKIDGWKPIGISQNNKRIYYKSDVKTYSNLYLSRCLWKGWREQNVKHSKVFLNKKNKAKVVISQASDKKEIITLTLRDEKFKIAGHGGPRKMRDVPNSLWRYRLYKAKYEKEYKERSAARRLQEITHKKLHPKVANKTRKTSYKTCYVCYGAGYVRGRSVREKVYNYSPIMAGDSNWGRGKTHYRSDSGRIRYRDTGRVRCSLCLGSGQIPR